MGKKPRVSTNRTSFRIGKIHFAKSTFLLNIIFSCLRRHAFLFRGKRKGGKKTLNHGLKPMAIQSSPINVHSAEIEKTCPVRKVNVYFRTSNSFQFLAIWFTQKVRNAMYARHRHWRIMIILRNGCNEADIVFLASLIHLIFSKISLIKHFWVNHPLHIMYPDDIQ